VHQQICSGKFLLEAIISTNDKNENPDKKNVRVFLLMKMMIKKFDNRIGRPSASLDASVQHCYFAEEYFPPGLWGSLYKNEIQQSPATMSGFFFDLET